MRCYYLSCRYKLLFNVHAYTFDMCNNKVYRTYLLTYLYSTALSRLAILRKCNYILHSMIVSLFYTTLGFATVDDAAICSVEIIIMTTFVFLLLTI